MLKLIIVFSDFSNRLQKKNTNFNVQDLNFQRSGPLVGNISCIVEKKMSKFQLHVSDIFIVECPTLELSDSLKSPKSIRQKKSWSPWEA